MCTAGALFGIDVVDGEQSSLNNGSAGVRGVPRRERPLDSADSPLLRFAAELRLLREKAGSPTYRELSRRAHYSAAALSEAAGGRGLPSLSVTMAYVAACDGDLAEWRDRWRAVADKLAVQNDKAEPEQMAGQPPYVGLAAFQDTDTDFFFGREQIVHDLMARVRERRFVGVFGASGVGKSSVLRAGLVATARSSGLSDGQRMPVLLLTPGPPSDGRVRGAAGGSLR
jgi:hypothetical protein